MGGAYVYTGRLWFPMTIHAGGNVTRGVIFGVSVSGNDVTPVAFLAGEPAGPE